jgi:hypothetical protein
LLNYIAVSIALPSCRQASSALEIETYSFWNMYTFALKETACFVGDFLICLSLLYGIDLALAELPLKNINSCERLVRYSLARQPSAGLESLTFVNIILLLGASCGVPLLLVHVVHICKLLYCIGCRLEAW